MLNSKQRSFLRSLASKEESVTQIGKSGINDAFLDGATAVLDKRELIKITVLQNSGLEPKEAGIELADALNAQLVCVTGRKIVLYKRSERDDVRHIELI